MYSIIVCHFIWWLLCSAVMHYIVKQVVENYLKLVEVCRKQNCRQADISCSKSIFRLSLSWQNSNVFYWFKCVLLLVVCFYCSSIAWVRFVKLILKMWQNAWQYILFEYLSLNKVFNFCLVIVKSAINGSLLNSL